MVNPQSQNTQNQTLTAVDVAAVIAVVAHVAVAKQRRTITIAMQQQTLDFDHVHRHTGYHHQANEGELSISYERFHQVFEFVQSGNQAFRRGRFEEAINCYSKATLVKPGDPIILSNRCAAYIRLSQFLKSRAPSASEYSPLYGLDPTTHAELALKDSEKVMSCRNNSVKSYILQADALFLLERYELAHDAVIAGLQLDPLCTHLQALLIILKRTCTGLVHGRSRVKPERSDEFDCTLCLKLLYEPVTTPCGHSFCRSCLFQSMDRSNKCPLCRTVLFITPRSCAISVTLNNIIQKNFSEEYAERKLENDNLVKLGVDLMPLFVMDAVRRIMEGNHRMGMVTLDSTTGHIADFACEVEITECEPLPDGRFYIEVEGRRRFHILRSWDQDGYRVAEVEWIQDMNTQEGTRERMDLQELTSNAAEYAQMWMTRAKELARQVKNEKGRFGGNDQTCREDEEAADLVT
ncbi:LON peptidase N-terminal domain and RING finger protein 1 [Bienertia sinuspersici]